MESPLASPMPWDLVAVAYEEEVVPMFETFAREALRLAAPPPGVRVVDVACGPGTLSALAARDGLQVDAIDFSPQMLERLAARRLAHVTARLGDGQALPYESGVFAAGFSMFGLMFFPDRAKGFAELRRVLAPGARAVVSSWIPLEQIPVMNAMFRAVFGALGTEPPQLPSTLSTEADARAEMSAAFADVTVHRVAHTQTAASPRALWESIARTMAPIALLREKVGPMWPKIDAAAAAAIAEVLGRGPTELKMTALLSVGTAR